MYLLMINFDCHCPFRILKLKVGLCVLSRIVVESCSVQKYLSIIMEPSSLCVKQNMCAHLRACEFGPSFFLRR